MNKEKNRNKESENRTDSDPIIQVEGNWKERVQKEKEELAREGKPGPRADDSWKEAARREKEAMARLAKEEEKDAEKHKRPLPPATFIGLVQVFATQAMLGLGDIENPITGKKEKDLDMAKYNIDMLQVLEEKTQGNLDIQEKNLLSQVLYDLRMRYVSAVG